MRLIQKIKREKWKNRALWAYHKIMIALALVALLVVIWAIIWGSCALSDSCYQANYQVKSYNVGQKWTCDKTNDDPIRHHCYGEEIILLDSYK